MFVVVSISSHKHNICILELEEDELLKLLQELDEELLEHERLEERDEHELEEELL